MTDKTLGKYTTKTVTIDAVRLGGDGRLQEFVPWLQDALFNGDIYRDYKSRIVIKTLEGEMRAGPGDWIIRGVKGELYPRRHDYFMMTYDRLKVTGEGAE
jgi:hypothetical protein